MRKGQGKGDKRLGREGMRGVQRGKHEELEKDDGKVRLIRVADSGPNGKQKVYGTRRE